MKSIMMTYPNFRTLPKGVKQMLLASESFFFEETTAPAVSRLDQSMNVAILSSGKTRFGSSPPWHPSWRN
jgi:hypothetical protein